MAQERVGNGGSVGAEEGVVGGRGRLEGIESPDGKGGASHGRRGHSHATLYLYERFSIQNTHGGTGSMELT